MQLPLTWDMGGSGLSALTLGPSLSGYIAGGISKFVTSHQLDCVDGSYSCF